MTRDRNEHADESCAYCPEPGADCCVRMVASGAGPDRSVYAHRLCAADRGYQPLYLLTGAPVSEPAP